MRARYPDAEGFVERDGVKVGYEVFGSGIRDEPALVFAPTDPLAHSRAWKAQVPYLARSSRAVTIDPRGNGRSDRPQSSAAYADTEFVADTIAVIDAVGVGQAVLVGLCSSAWTALLHPGRVLGVVSIATWAPFLTPPSAVRAVYDFDEVYDADEAGPRTTGTTGCATGEGTPSSSSVSWSGAALPVLRLRVRFRAGRLRRPTGPPGPPRSWPSSSEPWPLSRCRHQAGLVCAAPAGAGLIRYPSRRRMCAWLARSPSDSAIRSPLWRLDA
jgi:pimeloyl-ACP methyl ester carboxylesterase